MRSATPALDLLKEKLPAKGFERDAAVRHFHEVTAATSLNAAIFGAPGGALQKQLVASFDSCLTAVGELKARVASLEQSRDAAEKRALNAESRLNDTGKVTLDDLTDLRKSFEAPAQPNNDDLRERCRRAEARADEAVSTIDGLRERLARAEEALSNLRANSDASSTELKARCDDSDRERADEREMRARLDERVGALELSTEANQTRTTNALDDLTREHGFVLEWRARAEEQIRGLQQVDAA
jgi:chromosome segregation ATPase